MNQYKSLVSKAIGLGFSVSVWDEEQWAVKESKNKVEIYKHIESVDQPQLKFTDADGANVGGAMIVNGNDDELVSDFSDVEWLNKWFNEFRQSVGCVL